MFKKIISATTTCLLLNYCSIIFPNTLFSYVLLTKGKTGLKKNTGLYTNKNSEFIFDSVENTAVDYVFIKPTERWHVFFVTKYGEIFKATTYKNAGYSGSPIKPGLGLAVNEVYCNTPSSDFTVLDIHWKPNLSIDKFAVNFVNHCPELGRTVYGAFRYNSEIPLDLEEYIARQSIKLASLSTLSTTKRIVDLPYVQVGNTFKHLRFSIVTQAPLTLKLTTINNVKNRPETTLSLPTLTSNKTKLYIPMLKITDNKKITHTVKDISFNNHTSELKINTIFVKANRSNQ